MRIGVIIGLLIVGIVLFEANRRGILHNDRLQALVNITAIIGVLGAVIQFVVPLATEDKPNATPTPSIEIAIASSDTETPVSATQTPAPATEAPIAPTNTSGAGLLIPAPTAQSRPSRFHHYQPCQYLPACRL